MSPFNYTILKNGYLGSDTLALKLPSGEVAAFTTVDELFEALGQCENLLVQLRIDVHKGAEQVVKEFSNFNYKKYKREVFERMNRELKGKVEGYGYNPEYHKPYYAEIQNTEDKFNSLLLKYIVLLGFNHDKRVDYNRLKISTLNISKNIFYRQSMKVVDINGREIQDSDEKLSNRAIYTCITLYSRALCSCTEPVCSLLKGFDSVKYKGIVKKYIKCMKNKHKYYEVGIMDSLMEYHIKASINLAKQLIKETDHDMLMMLA